MEHDDSHEEEHGHGEIEPVVVKILSPSQTMAEEMKKAGVQSDALDLGSHPLEKGPYYSQLFALSSRLATNKGLIRVRGKNVDFIQVLQRN
ncbi:MAG TPA: hypothetical protein VIE86_00610 [Nitrososphaera sp.]